MPPPIPVVIAPYDPRWPAVAQSYSGGLWALGQVVISVHHIGSTAVPGLAAKPVIDLMPEVTNLAAFDRLRPLVEEAGYEWYGELGLSGRRYCTLTDGGGTRLAQLHVFQTGSPHIARHLAFRDYLRAHPDVVVAYEHEKRRARALAPDNSHAYTEAKSAWIRDIEARALAWSAGE